jgi:hypothetical protein
MLMEAVRAHLKMIAVPCLRMNREVGLQGNPDSKLKTCTMRAPFGVHYRRIIFSQAK